MANGQRFVTATPRAVVQPAVLFAAAAFMLFGVPHFLEDFQYGILARFGLTAISGGFVFGAFCAIILVLASFAATGSRRAAVWLMVAGSLACAIVLINHGRDMLSGAAYRHGTVSRALEIAMAVSAASLAWLAWPRKM